MLEFSTNMFLRENLINVDLKDVFIATALKKWAAKRLLNISTTMQSLKDNIKAANQELLLSQPKPEKISSIMEKGKTNGISNESVHTKKVEKTSPRQKITKKRRIGLSKKDNSNTKILSTRETKSQIYNRSFKQKCIDLVSILYGINVVEKEATPDGMCFYHSLYNLAKYYRLYNSNIDNSTPNTFKESFLTYVFVYEIRFIYC